MKRILELLHYYLFVRNSKWNLIFLLILFIPVIWYIFYKNNPIKKGNYTIGYVYRIYWPVVNAKTVMYSYTVNKNKYTSTDDYNSNKKPKIGKRYLVQFSLEDPSYSDIFQDIPVPDSIKSAPPEGWKKLPEWAKNAKK
ncbi:hypothetical protein [Chryseobacterium sp. MFBS3-17]|uniref:hypothetical protein n=1 Tax=Chryseobacterium sp. MFBS3-17 TaxID=2886689 RepID=UPI001D0E742B|nr:hypothetical protein [Chryseobacterium sp. MFBS3-17]MCC2591141.1 hypothetical protein [Chryseobacterium sp. MFBS3-17]